MFVLLYFINWFLNPIYTKLTVAIVCLYLFTSYSKAELIYYFTEYTFYSVIFALFVMLFINKKNDIDINKKAVRRTRAKVYCKLLGIQSAIIFISITIVAIILSFQSNYVDKSFVLESNSLYGREILNSVLFFPWVISSVFSVFIIYIIKINREPFWVKIMFNDPKRHPFLFIHNAFCGMTYLYLAASLLFIPGIYITYVCSEFLKRFGLNIFSSSLVTTFAVIATTLSMLLCNFARPKLFFLRKSGVVTNSIVMILLCVFTFVIFYFFCDYSNILSFYSGLNHGSYFANIISNDKNIGFIIVLIIACNWGSHMYSGFIVRYTHDLNVREMLLLPLFIPCIMIFLSYSYDLLPLLDKYKSFITSGFMGFIVVIASMVLYLLQFNNAKDQFSLYAPGMFELVRSKKNIIEYYKYLFPLMAMSVGLIIFNGWQGIVLSWGSTYLSYLTSIWCYLVFGIMNTYKWCKLDSEFTVFMNK